MGILLVLSGLFLLVVEMMSLMWIPKQNQELQAKLSHLVRMLNIGGDVAGGGEKKTREKSRKQKKTKKENLAHMVA